MKIKFLAVGGTIDKIYFDTLSQYEVGESNINGVLQNARVNFEYDVDSLLKKDSLDMTNQDRLTIQQVIKNEPNDKIIITHGTDTMIDTAKVLDSIKHKIIVLTGAMEPARFKSSDAVFNLGLATAAVQILPNGVYLAISGRIYTPDNVKKNRVLMQFEEQV